MTAERGGYRAVIFDMDGVLVDSEPAFFEAINLVLTPTGKQIPWDSYKSLLGTSTSGTWRKVLEILDLKMDEMEPYVAGFEEILLDLLRQPRPLLPGVAQLIESLKQRSVPIALATASREEWVKALLGAARPGKGAAELSLATFDAVVWRQMVETGKPAPDLYLKAAELLSIPAERCVAIEDTPSGIASARAAGMFAVQVRAASTALPPIAEANLVIDTLAELPLSLLGGALLDGTMLEES